MSDIGHPEEHGVCRGARAMLCTWKYWVHMEALILSAQCVLGAHRNVAGGDSYGRIINCDAIDNLEVYQCAQIHTVCWCAPCVSDDERLAHLQTRAAPQSAHDPV